MKVKIFGWIITIERANEKVRQANEAKRKRAMEAVKKAVAELEREGKKITAYNVAKRAGISPHTAKKYLQKGELSNRAYSFWPKDR